jgi:cytochrome c-type biogenesis protein CcmE
VDLTPRTSADNAPLAPRRRAPKWGYVAVLVLVVVGGGIIVSQFLTSAIDYYCNVDEIGVREGCEADRRIRVQGTVEEGSLAANSGTTNFVMIFNNKELSVTYTGDPGGIFQECIPVVVHGQLVNNVFEANRIEVKHSNEYVADNAQRMDDAEGQTCSPPVE